MSGTNRFVIEYSTGYYDDREDYVIPVKYNGSKSDIEKLLRDTYYQRIAAKKLGMTFNRLFGVKRRVPVESLVYVGNKTFDIWDFGERGKYYGPDVYELDEWFDYE